MRQLVILFLTGLVVLSACGKEEIPLPEGMQTVHAVIQPVPISLKRRGTHALMGIDEKMFAFAESTAVNLRALEGREVELEGMLERNTDSDALPVFIVQKVLQGGLEQSKSWAIPALGLSLKLPRSWKGSIKGKVAEFTASGSLAPTLVITLKARAAASASKMYGPLPVSSAVSSAGGLFTVGLKKASAIFSPDGRLWIVTVDSSTQQQTLFTFSISPDVTPSPLRSSFDAILKTVSFTSSAAATSVTSRAPSSVSLMPSSVIGGSPRAAGEGSPCGGAAGVLCPGGLYCRITDPVSESGECTKRSR